MFIVIKVQYFGNKCSTCDKSVPLEGFAYICVRRNEFKVLVPNIPDPYSSTLSTDGVGFL